MERVEDSDLDELLDDALADFDKRPSKEELESHKLAKENVSQMHENPDALFNDFFDNETTQRLQDEWHNAVKELKDEDPQLADNLQRLSDLARGCSSENMFNQSAPNNSNGKDFAETMKSALEAMSKDSGTSSGEEDLINNFLKFGFGQSAGQNSQQGDELGMMENLMKSMLSKEMLYQPMNEMCKKYPEWLDQNKEKVSKVDLQRYKSQLSCLEEICSLFEAEESTDSELVKADRFQKIMILVDNMQQYGNPPQDLVAAEGAGPPLPPDDCCIS